MPGSVLLLLLPAFSVSYLLRDAEALALLVYKTASVNSTAFTSGAEDVTISFSVQVVPRLSQNVNRTLYFTTTTSRLA